MKLYNTLTREKEEFQPLEAGKVKIYACGPTVYNYFHIGNARCFTVFDMLRRYLEYRGYTVTFVQNFTDIDDKMIRRAAEEHTEVSTIANTYIGEYFKDAAGLGIQPATVHPRATEHIADIISLIKRLIEKKYAYEANGDVYYSPKAFSGYGKLSHMPIEDLEAGARVLPGEIKKEPLDFALWKAQKPGEPAWESPWGMGRPGWHIECSAMAQRYLGDTIDIHCGGQDLCFPHHENEIAQSEASTDKPFARYWMHNGYINVDNQKMSKSLNNFFTVRDAAKLYGYQTIRFFLLSSHYRSPVNFSAEILAQAKQALLRIHTCQDSLDFAIKSAQRERRTADSNEETYWREALGRHRSRFVEAMDDDLNTADGIAAIFELVRDINTLINGEIRCSAGLLSEAQSLLSELTELMGLEKKESTDDSRAEKIQSRIEERAAAKKSKDYARADAIRAELLREGVVLEDTPQGTKYRILADQ